MATVDLERVLVEIVADLRDVLMHEPETLRRWTMHWDPKKLEPGAFETVRISRKQSEKQRL